MRDGDTLEFPGLSLRILETPGHTIESISILVFDRQKDPTSPHAVLTGDAGRDDLVWATERVSAAMLHAELASDDPPLVLDIRGPREWGAKHLSGSVNLPLAHLQERIAEVPRTRRIAVHCAGGYRSSMAVSILNQFGITNVIELAGGVAAWEAARFPIVSA